MALSLRRSQSKPTYGQTDDVQLNKLLTDLYNSMLSKAGVNGLIAGVTDPISEDVATVQTDITTLQGAKIQTVTYTEKFVDLDLSATGANLQDGVWGDVSLAANGVVAGDICELVLYSGGGASNSGGVRTNGSALARIINVHENNVLTMNAVAAASSIVEIYLNDVSEFNVYLTGYWHFSTT